MNEGTPKLYANKPKKAQMKLVQPSPPPPPPPSSSAAAAEAASYSMGTPAQNHPPPPQSHPPPPPGKESFARRYKFLWPVLLTVNLAVGAYFFMRISKKDTETAEEEDSKVALAPLTSSSVPSTASMADKSPSTTPVVQTVIKREPIPPNQQRELFKWMLEEKRKIRPKDAEERKRIDEEKAILKQFLRVKSLPNL